MSILIILLALIGVGAILRYVTLRFALKGKPAIIVNVVVLGLSILWLLYAFGYIQFSGDMKVPFR